MRGVLAFWENRPEVVQLLEVAEAVIDGRRGAEKACGSELPVGPVSYWCSRRPTDPLDRHRHIATAGPIVCAAWPGDHEPTLADLEATP
jgi:hypothetical protein